VININGRRYWSYGNAREPIPNNVDTNGIRHIFNGTNIYIKNSTNRQIVFRAMIQSDNSQAPLVFNDPHTVNSGDTVSWFLDPKQNVHTGSQGNKEFVVVKFEGFDPSNGQKLGEWGPNPQRYGLFPNQDAVHQAPQQNGTIHETRDLLFIL